MPVESISNTLAAFEGQELSKSDRPELTSAKIVISGGEPVKVKSKNTCCMFSIAGEMYQ